MTKITLKNLQSELKEVIEGHKRLIEGLSESDNPLVQREKLKAESRLEAFEAVLLKISGNRIALNFYKHKQEA